MTTGLPDFPVTTHPAMLPVHFEVPVVNAAPQGLYPATFWTDDTGPTRWLNGVEVRGANYGGADAAGVWEADWCTPPAIDNDERKEGTRPPILDPFDPLTVWGYDECDLTEPSRAEVRDRAAQIMRLQEQPMVEREFAERLLTDAADTAAGIVSAVDLTLALGHLEAAFAETNTVGFIHAGAQWAAVAAESRLVSRTGTGWTTPMGHRWVFGGGYVAGLGDTLVATSQPFGWRNTVAVREAIDERHNTFAAIAERSVTVGYEAVIAAVTVTPEVTP
ncbi:hypothetical protein [Mycobacterium sp. IS-1556]|uniref:hypothetical protein n=1 Tax=Mycobacterium sp. IS-1556 TaxID=1772276 RepID=UPI0007416D53|nr:hypothetical protein [Mycobacterium sp. IS-1556]KUH86305.1 hypothetical protein AU187_05870 [Mycobacterium sp. IS-1556]